jgi:hypothetical protein
MEDNRIRSAPERQIAGLHEALAGVAASLVAGATLLAALGALCAVTLFGVQSVLLVALGLALAGGLAGVLAGALANRGRPPDAELGPSA